MEVNIYNPNIKDLIKFLKKNEGVFHVKLCLPILHGTCKGEIGNINEVKTLSIKKNNKTSTPYDISGVLYDLDIVLVDDSKTNLMIIIRIPERIYSIEYEVLKYYPKVLKVITKKYEYLSSVREARPKIDADISNAFKSNDKNIFEKIQSYIDNTVRKIIESDIKKVYRELIEEIKCNHYDDVIFIPEDKLHPYIKKYYN